ncbi:MAG: CHAT domain-containing protein [Planctomycetes bacterium]|nr:CHAT domain-containing protein [Planctomycetota bacterium]
MSLHEPKVTLQVLWQNEDSIRVTPFKEGSALESTIKTSRICPFHSGLVRDRAREVLSILARANAGEHGLFDELVSAGQAIYLDLVPAFLKEKLQEAAGRNLVLHLDRPLVGIPWELLHDGDEFLGQRFRIGRLVSVEGERGPAPMQRRMEGPLSALVVADPSGDLPGARAEAEEVAELLEDAPGIGSVTMLVGKVTLRVFRDELMRHDILHYAGHADFVRRTGEAQLRLADGPFTTRLVAQLKGRVDFPGLVVLNACGSADATAALAAGADPLVEATDLASAFLLAGVRHVVGTLWEVRDEVARTFATTFHRALCAQETIGASMSAARDALARRHGSDGLLWAGHLLYGDPTWRATEPSNLTFADLDVLDGLQAKYRDELFSSDAAARLLAATMLLRLGDRSVIPAVARELTLLERWMSPQATQREQRQARLVVSALAAAAGMAPSEPPETLPDVAVVRALVERLGR